MTILSKVKTLIEYAKFGVSFLKLQKGTVGEIYLCKNVSNVGWHVGLTANNSLGSVATSLIAPYLTGIFGNKVLENNTQLTKVYLPKCTSITNADSMFKNAKALKEVDLSSLRVVPYHFFYGCSSLEVLKLGIVEAFSSVALTGCTALHTIEVANGSSGSLYLHHCPNITQESLHGIIDAYSRKITAGPLTLQLGEENLLKISEEYKEKALSNNLVLK